MDRLGAALAFRLLLISWLAARPALARVRHPLPVLWMMPPGSGAGGGNRTAGIVSAVELALQDLEKQPAPLGNYQIQMQPLDSPVGPDPNRDISDEIHSGADETSLQRSKTAENSLESQFVCDRHF